jgi:hypothetical protein
MLRAGHGLKVRYLVETLLSGKFSHKTTMTCSGMEEKFFFALLVDHALILIIISKDPGGRSAVDD